MEAGAERLLDSGFSSRHLRPEVVPSYKAFCTLIYGSCYLGIYDQILKSSNVSRAARAL